MYTDTGSVFLFIGAYSESFQLFHSFFYISSVQYFLRFSFLVINPVSDCLFVAQVDTKWPISNPFV